MKKICSIHIPQASLHLALLLLRSVVSLTMLFYGYHKLSHFSEMIKEDFWIKEVNFLGLGASFSLALTIFAEFFCSLFVLIGLCTRLSLLPLLFCMGYIVVHIDHAEIIEAGKHGYELNHAFYYAILYLVLLLTGPGKWSFDKLIAH